MKYHNVSQVPLSIAVFLATDNYDYSGDPNTISTTTLIKPLRQIILAARVPADDAVVDLSSMIASRVGTAIHDGFERAWLQNYQRAMMSLGYSKEIVARVRVNPHRDEVRSNDQIIPIYLEQRAHRKIGKYTISGKPDFIGDGRLEDVKTTSTYTAMNNTNDDKHVLQGSIYRWIDPEVITRDDMSIQFLFTDWSKAKALGDPKYPQTRHLERKHVLMSEEETETWIKKKLQALNEYWDVPEAEIPLCSDAELWRSEPVYKYYKNPTKTAKSTKNFDTKDEAFVRMAEDNNVGVVKEVLGQVSACRYCQAYSVCTQKDALIANGDLVI